MIVLTKEVLNERYVKFFNKYEEAFKLVMSYAMNEAVSEFKKVVRDEIKREWEINPKDFSTIKSKMTKPDNLDGSVTISGSSIGIHKLEHSPESINWGSRWSGIDFKLMHKTPKVSKGFGLYRETSSGIFTVERDSSGKYLKTKSKAPKLKKEYTTAVPGMVVSEKTKVSEHAKDEAQEAFNIAFMEQTETYMRLLGAK